MKSGQGDGYELFLMRHGIAAPRTAASTLRDEERRLTPKGRKRTEQIARGLRRLGYQFDWIVSSPLARALETAEIVAATARTPSPVDLCPALRPGGAFEELAAFLAREKRRRRILLVGHEPDLGHLAGRLLGAGPAANLEFKKGGCCLIRCRDLLSGEDSKLIWWLTPRLLRALR
ncbi:MAG TPA: phosphohistidine phosphatase SixA [Terriglobia bacterium]|nr:phosphohistidine phosphatase SixA [Terriglobia bacterium]